MNEIKNLIKTLIQIEYKNANKKFPMFSSLHEGESVLREEIEEVGEYYKFIIKTYYELWHNVRANDIKAALEDVESIKNIAEYLIKEVAQVAAMCEKIKGSIEDKNDEYNR